MSGLLGATAAAVLAVAGAAGASETPAMDAVARGHLVAHHICANCHAVDRGGLSPRPTAPPFASWEMEYTASVQGRVADFARRGHFEMPPQTLSEGDVADVAAYIRSLAAPRR